jgi:hypothetical protein
MWIDSRYIVRHASKHAWLVYFIGAIPLGKLIIGRNGILQQSLGVRSGISVGVHTLCRGSKATYVNIEGVIVNLIVTYQITATPWITGLYLLTDLMEA